MGRAIDMEKDIDALKLKTKHIDIVEKTKEKTDGKKKANNKGSSSNSKSSDTKNRDNKKKNDRDGDSSK